MPKRLKVTNKFLIFIFTLRLRDLEAKKYDQATHTPTETPA